jgi:TonB family protein
VNRLPLIVGVGLALGACSRSGSPSNESGAPAPPAFEPPVALNAEPPVRYPIALYEAHTEGTVVLHLFADSTGKIAPDSTRVAESSGSAALDSAALAGVPKMRFAPARRNGVPVATAFLQPVHFEHPSANAAGDGS